MATQNKPERNGAGGLVYSTDGGRMCPACRRPVALCGCQAITASARQGAPDGVVRVSRQTRGRAGRSVTVVAGLALAPTALAEMGKRLRTACGAGGTVKDGAIEIQGDHCDGVIALLRAQGLVVQRASG